VSVAAEFDGRSAAVAAEKLLARAEEMLVCLTAVEFFTLCMISL